MNAGLDLGVPGHAAALVYALTGDRPPRSCCRRGPVELMASRSVRGVASLIPGESGWA
jgi:hypothetical protein